MFGLARSAERSLPVERGSQGEYAKANPPPCNFFFKIQPLQYKRRSYSQKCDQAPERTGRYIKTSRVRVFHSITLLYNQKKKKSFLGGFITKLVIQRQHKP